MTRYIVFFILYVDNMETLTLLFDCMDLFAKILGYIALYSIAMALIDWRRTERFKNGR